MVDYKPPRQITPIFNPYDYFVGLEAATASVANLIQIQEELDAIGAELAFVGTVYNNPTNALTTTTTNIQFTQYTINLAAGTYMIKYNVMASISAQPIKAITAILNVNGVNTQSNTCNYNSNAYQTCWTTGMIASAADWVLTCECQVTAFSGAYNLPVTLNNTTLFPILTANGVGAGLSIMRIK